jgi:hypothetical protein
MGLRDFDDGVRTLSPGRGVRPVAPELRRPGATAGATASVATVFTVFVSVLRDGSGGERPIGFSGHHLES